MRFSDLVSGLDITIYPQIALIIFVAVFFSVVIRSFLRTSAADAKRAARLPLGDATATRTPDAPSHPGPADPPGAAPTTTDAPGGDHG